MQKLILPLLMLTASPAFAAGGPFFSLRNTNFVVLLAFLVFIGILLWAKVPRKLGDMLDDRANQIKAELCGLLHGFSREHHAQIFAVFVDYTHLGRNDIFVEPGAIDRWWRRPIGATGCKWWYRLISRQL